AAGCASTDLRKVYAPFENGDFARAADVAEKVEPKKGVDTLWVHLERGAALLAGGRFAASIAAFQAADAEIGRLDERAVVSASEQTASLSGLVFDDRSTEYAGTDYDRILVCTSLAIGHALAGDIELAGVYARRQLDRQLAVEERRRARIERAEREREKASGEGFGQSYDQVVANEDFQQQMTELSTWTNPAYADFSVPYAYYVGAVLLGAQGAGDEMRDQARGLAGILPDSPVAQELVQAPRLPDYVFVLFENGLAPARVDASILYVTSLGFTRVPIPRLAFQPEGDRAGSLLVLVDGREFETEPLDSMDEVVATDFADRLPAIFFRAVVAVVLKEVAAKQVQDSNDNVLTFIVASILKSVVAPDLRTWRTLPGEHQVAQVPVPSDGRVRLELLSRRGGSRGG
ncbi:MAG TPA: hypothetical protein VJP77_00220, partial [Planctomycetota bacterium]|nr:hypothetical protein [Planctomycetota bacterium]